MKRNMTNLIERRKILPAIEDDRGTISDIILGEKILHVGIINSKPNAVRGTHFHKLQTQYNYILSGKVELVVKNALDEKGEKETMILNPGDFIKIPPNVIHSIKALTDSTFLVFTSEARIGQNYEEDTFRVKL